MGLKNGRISSSTGYSNSWVQNTAYKVGDLVYYSNNSWLCSTAHTSSTSFDFTKFNKVLNEVGQFIKGGDAEAGNIFNTYADAAGTSPVDGTGGSSTLTIALSGSAPLTGVASFVITHPASNTQGMGASYDFTIDSSSQAKVMQISFDYVVSSGTFIAGNAGDRTSVGDSDITVWIYDVTNAVIIQPSTYRLYTNSSTSSNFIANFQSASNSTNYRLIFHSGTTNTNAYTLKFDNVEVQPTEYAYGSPITDWTSYTPTFTGFGTLTNVSVRSRRVGDNLELQGYFVSGTSTATTAQMTLGYAGINGNVFLDPTKLTAGVNNLVGTGVFSATSASYPVLLALGNTNINYLYFGFQSAGQPGNVAQNANTFIASGTVFTFYAKVPIQGWSSSVQMSDSSDTRIVAARYSTSAATAITGTPTTITYGTNVYDTHSAMSGNTYVVPVSGFYKLTGGVSLASNSWSTGSVIQQVFVNGTVRSYVAILNPAYTGSAGVSAWGSTTIQVNAGDQLTFRVSQGQTASVNLNGDPLGNYIAIERVTGPSAIAATETIAASYWASTNQSTNNTAPINFDSREHDTHGAVTTGSGWKFTAPATGLYNVSAFIANSGSSTNNVVLYKNGSAYKGLTFLPGSAATNGSTDIRLIAGDYIDVRVTIANGTSGNASLSSSGASSVSIKRIGL